MDSAGEGSIWSRFWMRMNAFAIAMDYDPMEEMQARIARLEREIVSLRAEPGLDPDRVERKT